MRTTVPDLGHPLSLCRARQVVRHLAQHRRSSPDNLLSRIALTSVDREQQKMKNTTRVDHECWQDCRQSNRMTACKLSSKDTPGFDLSIRAFRPVKRVDSHHSEKATSKSFGKNATCRGSRLNDYRLLRAGARKRYQLTLYSATRS